MPCHGLDPDSISDPGVTGTVCATIPIFLYISTTVTVFSKPHPALMLNAYCFQIPGLRDFSRVVHPSETSR